MVPLAAATAAPDARLLIPSSVSGGSFVGMLQDFSAHFGAPRLCLDLERSCSRDAVTPDDRIVLTAALKALSSEELQIVTLHAMNGLKHREIAALLQLPLATVLSKYRRALKKLKDQLKEGIES